MGQKEVKVSVTGAAGQIGYALLFRIASGQMFGPDVPVHLQLLELEPALKALEGVAMELDDCAFPLLNNITITSDEEVAFKDTDWALLVGAAPRKKGMERGDLLKINGSIFNKQGKAIDKVAAENVKTLVVGNPCNTNSYVTMKNAPRISTRNFYAMTMLDQNRAKTQLAQKAGVPVSEVNNMIIWGNHSATQYPDFFNAKIGGAVATSKISDQKWLETDFISTVQKRGAAIIEARGLSSAASAANAVVDSVRYLTDDSLSSKDNPFSMCISSQGEYGVPEGLLFSYPCYLEGGELKVNTDVSHEGFGKEKIEITTKELEEEKNAVTEMGLTS